MKITKLGRWFATPSGVALVAMPSEALRVVCPPGLSLSADVLAALPVVAGACGFNGLEIEVQAVKRNQAA
jgi:hypothetical protein